MNPYFQDSTRTLYNKSCTGMSELADESVQMIVTSPPYFGQRKYNGNQDVIFGNNPNCVHEWNSINQTIVGGFRGGTSTSGIFTKEEAEKLKEATGSNTKVSNSICSLCGAWEGSLGLEETPELYIAHIIEIMQEMKRVLRSDGVIFLNISDTYWGSGQGVGTKNPTKKQASNKGTLDLINSDKSLLTGKHPVLKNKDLCLIPFRLVIAAQEAGWWVRSIIIWDKPNTMPESVTDRPTESHEYILMLTKSANYYWDQESIREPQKLISIARLTRNHSSYDPGYPLGVHNHLSKYYTDFEGKSVEEIAEKLTGRNIRSVWEFPTKNSTKGHFATFPEKLPEICIKAASPEYGCCNKCGKPYERIIERTVKRYNPSTSYTADTPGNNNGTGLSTLHTDPSDVKIQTLGWKQVCKCSNSKPVPSVILDPFCGSGTTLKVASMLGRKSIGYEISTKYCEIIINKNRQGMLF